MANDCENVGGEEGRVLHRDNVRFSFWRDNGEPKLAADCRGELPLVTTLQLIRDRTKVATA